MTNAAIQTNAVQNLSKHIITLQYIILIYIIDRNFSTQDIAPSVTRLHDYVVRTILTVLNTIVAKYIILNNYYVKNKRKETLTTWSRSHNKT